MWPRDPAEQNKEDYEFAQAFDAVNQIVVFSKSLDGAKEIKPELFVRTFTTKQLS